MSLKEQLENLKDAKKIKKTVRSNSMNTFIDEIVKQTAEEIEKNEKELKTLFLTIDDFSNNINPFNPVSYNILIKDFDGYPRFKHSAKTERAIRGAFMSILKSPEYTDCELKYTINRHQKNGISVENGTIEFHDVLSMIAKKF